MHTTYLILAGLAVMALFGISNHLRHINDNLMSFRDQYEFWENNKRML